MKKHYHDKDLNLDLTDDQIKLRNRYVTKYMHLAMRFAKEANNPDHTHYSLADVQSAVFEALVVTCGKRVRDMAQGNKYDGVGLGVYLKPRLKGAAKNFIEREASTYDNHVSMDVANHDGEETMSLHDVLSDTNTLSGAINQDACEAQRRTDQVVANIEKHILTIREAIEELTLKQRYIIKCTQNGRTQKYIGDKLGIKRQSVAAHQKRAYVAFRQQLEKKGLCSDDFFL